MAVITALAGILAGYPAGSNRASPLPRPSHRSLIIDDLSSKRFEVARIIVWVNGQPFSYPSGQVWAEIGPNMPKESFRIPAADTYVISFAGFVSNTGNVPTLHLGQSRPEEFRREQLRLRIIRWICTSMREAISHRMRPYKYGFQSGSACANAFRKWLGRVIFMAGHYR